MSAHEPMFVLQLSDRSCRELALALDLLARRLRSDGVVPAPEVRQLRDLLAAADRSRLEPTKRAIPVESIDAGPVLFDLDEVAHRLRVHRRTVERAVRDGHLRSVRIGRRRRIAPVDLDAYIAALRGVHGERPAGVADRTPVTRRPHPIASQGAT